MSSPMMKTMLRCWPAARHQFIWRAVVALAELTHCVFAEEVDVRYRGKVDLEPFDCTDVKSSFLRRVCYDYDNNYLLVQLGSVWYHYCNVPEETVNSLIETDSPAEYFNAQVRNKFSCSDRVVPQYD